MGEYWALKSLIDSVMKTSSWSLWKAEGEEINSAGIGVVKLGSRVNLEGWKVSSGSSSGSWLFGFASESGDVVLWTMRKFLSSLRS